MLGKLSADVSLKYFFLFSPEIDFDSSCKLPLFDTICMKLQFYFFFFFFEKKQKTTTKKKKKKKQQQKTTTTTNKQKPKKKNKKKQQQKTKLSRLLNAQIVVRVNKSIRLGVNVHVILDISDKKSYK